MEAPFHGVVYVPPTDTHWLHTGGGGDTAGGFTHDTWELMSLFETPALA